MNQIYQNFFVEEDVWTHGIVNIISQKVVRFSSKVLKKLTNLCALPRYRGFVASVS